jgi:hypothetical protein
MGKQVKEIWNSFSLHIPIRKNLLVIELSPYNIVNGSNL